MLEIATGFFRNAAHNHLTVRPAIAVNIARFDDLTGVILALFLWKIRATTSESIAFLE